jgi:hypothetical protein
MDFNFTSQICTTKEQSEQLLALGLKKETADMCLHGTDISFTLPFSRLVKFVSYPIIPAWSLHRLIELLGLSKICLNIDLYDSPYEEVIHRIDIFINTGVFNREYLK